MFTARARQTPFLLSEIVPFSAVAGETLLCKKFSDMIELYLMNNPLTTL